MWIILILWSEVNMQHFDSIAILKNSEYTGTVYVCGYFQSGDGGGGYYIWDSASARDDNGGTVIASNVSADGRWLLKHKGQAHFYHFGILDDSKPADDALDAMVNDLSIMRIEAGSNLLFQRRHHFNRSSISLNFNHYHISTQGIAPIVGADDPFAAVFFFQGEISTAERQFTLTETLNEQTDIFPVADATQFKIEDWYALQVNHLAGSDERELQKLVQVIAIIDDEHIQINYSNGWQLDTGRVISWRKVIPVRDVTISNFHFTGAGIDAKTGSHPIAFEYAIYSNVFAVHAIGSFWPVIMRRWNTHYITKQCSLQNPVNTAYGGAGYLTQQIYCLYGHVSDCYVANARHLNDFTASAYCMVENCHATGQSAEKGPFVTHGQYEHDLTYTGNSGLMTFANSGAQWGGCAKRINVRQHVCPWFVDRYKISDLTLEDVIVIADAAIPSSGMLWVNADGLQMRGCKVDRELRITQASVRSVRRNLINGCHFSWQNETLPIVQSSVKSAVNIIDSVFDGLNEHSFASSAPLSFERCQFNGMANTALLKVAANRFSLRACVLESIYLQLSGDSEKHWDITLLTQHGGGIDFSDFSANSSLVFVYNRLQNSEIIAKPASSDYVIWQNNFM